MYAAVLDSGQAAVARGAAEPVLLEQEWKF